MMVPQTNVFRYCVLSNISERHVWLETTHHEVKSMTTLRLLVRGEQPNKSGQAGQFAGPALNTSVLYA